MPGVSRGWAAVDALAMSLRPIAGTSPSACSVDNCPDGTAVACSADFHGVLPRSLRGGRDPVEMSFLGSLVVIWRTRIPALWCGEVVISLAR
jgi:hypothetical protein